MVTIWLWGRWWSGHSGENICDGTSLSPVVLLESPTDEPSHSLTHRREETSAINFTKR